MGILQLKAKTEELESSEIGCSQSVLRTELEQDEEVVWTSATLGGHTQNLQLCASDEGNTGRTGICLEHHASRTLRRNLRLAVMRYWISRLATASPEKENVS